VSCRPTVRVGVIRARITVFVVRIAVISVNRDRATWYYRGSICGVFGPETRKCKSIISGAFDLPDLEPVLPGNTNRCSVLRLPVRPLNRASQLVRIFSYYRYPKIAKILRPFGRAFKVRFSETASAVRGRGCQSGFQQSGRFGPSGSRPARYPCSNANRCAACVSAPPSIPAPSQAAEPGIPRF
jgi:hypothetical protein